MDHITLSQKNITLDKQSQKKLLSVLSKTNSDFVIAGELLQNFTNGAVRKHIVFEHLDGIITSEMYPSPKEPPPFISVRWNAFNGYVICKKEMVLRIPKETQTNPETLLEFALTHNFLIQVVPKITATQQPQLCLSDLLSPSMLVVKNQHIRNIAVHLNILRNKITSVFTEVGQKRAYYRKIVDIKKKKEIVVQINFGGLGDCLAYSSLPRLLKEQFDIDFYLSESSRNIFRNSDIEKLCFELNPFFKGFKDSDNVFIAESFISERSMLTDLSASSIVSRLEKQFGLVGNGLPEIYYKPKFVSGYEHTLLCDNNWFSGEKWGLYNDPAILSSIIQEWKGKNDKNEVEYSVPDKQNIFEYIDKVYSAAKFVTYFSGGNSLVAALNKPATIIVPENLDGNSISGFYFKNSKIKYVRNKSLVSYN